MTDALFSALDIDIRAAKRPGYRLERLELLNWGTFDGRVDVLRLGGDNTLVTGDIGSGKSTIVDAVTTLLLPANRINYNKAAGADTRERSLRSYVLGHYKSERVESTGASRPVGLRDQRHYSVLLGVFRNEGHDATVSLAQVFWMPGASEHQPRRFFVSAERDLSIADDFTDFGTDPVDLKRALRARGADIQDHYPPYGTRLRRLLGIRSQQALELFHQTISMKSVGNLTEFVRQHMLEPTDARSRIDKLVQHFEDLTRAHEAVRKARDQLDALTPLVAACDEHDARSLAIETGQAAREAVPYWSAERRIELLGAERARLAAVQAKAQRDEETHRDRIRALDEERGGLLRAREGAGGARLGAIETELGIEQRYLDERKSRARRFGELLDSLGLSDVEDAASFERTRELVLQRQGDAQSSQEAQTERLAQLLAAVRTAEEAGVEVNLELRSLQGRSSSIDKQSLDVRDRLAVDLGVEQSLLPFVGELVQVRAEHADWRGAAERVLRGFALSVLCPPALYTQVADWVDSHHLRARFVYFRAGEVPNRRAAPLAAHTVLADLLEIKDGPHARWLHAELGSRAGHACVTDVRELQDHRFAVTRHGQVKGNHRHEKDDRFAIDDRRRWVLGWSNQEKVEAILAEAQRCSAELARAKGAYESERRSAASRSNEATAIAQLASYTDFGELDWRQSVRRIATLDDEQKRLRDNDPELGVLQRRLDEVSDEMQREKDAETTATMRLGGIGEQLRVLEADVERTNQTRAGLAVMTTTARDRLAAAYPALAERRAPASTLDESQQIERELIDELLQEHDEHARRRKTAGDRAIRLIGEFRNAWPADTTELGADIESSDEYRELHARIASDDLPRFEAEFKRQLNTNTINEIAGFQAWLEQAGSTIRSRIRTIDESLGAIDYNAGTRISLLTDWSSNVEVKTFRDDLRRCTDDALSADDQYSEERFARVKAIIERLRGREGLTEADRRWTALVTDVRNWFVFAASEHDRETGVEREHYTDSDGKSGGQKEKLAYTVLAASLAYQFGLEWGVAASRDFRFVVIDEAFGRGSDLSTRYALALFARLGLQLLVVTPLQKVHVIEPFVNAVGFVENRTGQRSGLRTLTIEQYHDERARHHQGRVS